jgi:hypothetical protein
LEITCADDFDFDDLDKDVRHVHAVVVHFFNSFESTS